MAVATVEDQPEEERLEEKLWQELEDKEGHVEVSTISDEWLESVRQRVITGELPPFITPDYREGWGIYARREITSRFVRYRERVGGHNIRAFFPTLQEVATEPALWTTGERDPKEAIDHAWRRFDKGIDTSILLHGSKAVAFGDATWDEVKARGIARVKAAVKEAVQRNDHPELPFDEWAQKIEQEKEPEGHD